GRELATEAHAGFKAVPADHGRHLEERRRFPVTRPHDIEEQLLLPRVRHRGGVVQPIAPHGGRTDGTAAANQGEKCQEQPGRPQLGAKVEFHASTVRPYLAAATMFPLRSRTSRMSCRMNTPSNPFG